jgi:nitroreductase
LNSIIDAIKDRRSTRRYLDKKIPKKVVEKIIDAGIYAPSSHNGQPWNFLVISNRKRIKAFSDELKRWYRFLVRITWPLRFIPWIRDGAKQIRPWIRTEKDLFFYSAAVVMIIHAKKDEFSREDCACCGENMMLAARSLGIGSCWIGLADVALKRNKAMRKRLGIPGSHKTVATIVFGYPKSFPKALPRREFKKEWVG